MRILAVIFCSFFIFMSAGNAVALDGPTEKIKISVTKVLNILNSDLGDKEKIDKCLKETEDVFSWYWISRRSLGKEHWEFMSQEQQKEFIRVFSSLLGRTYFEKIKGQSENIRIDYVKEEKVNSKVIKVYTEIVKEGTSLPVVYNMYLSSSGWKIFDIEVEGVSMVTNYRVQFKSFLQSNTIDDLIQNLKNKL